MIQGVPENVLERELMFKIGDKVRLKRGFRGIPEGTEGVVDQVSRPPFNSDVYFMTEVNETAYGCWVSKDLVELTDALENNIVKRGYWINLTRDNALLLKFQCSRCAAGSGVAYPFCPYCGSKMEE